MPKPAYPARYSSLLMSSQCRSDHNASHTDVITLIALSTVTIVSNHTIFDGVPMFVMYVQYVLNFTAPSCRTSFVIVFPPAPAPFASPDEDRRTPPAAAARSGVFSKLFRFAATDGSPPASAAADSVRSPIRPSELASSSSSSSAAAGTGVDGTSSTRTSPTSTPSSSSSSPWNDSISALNAPFSLLTSSSYVPSSAIFPFDMQIT
mmetsp:Transcript_12120/g.43664  ORF Transcript_12120/g.43664 Transcript_12120/m.43664 type:complete len:206 (+) Transcript_12120:2572-3189(+)